MAGAPLLIAAGTTALQAACELLLLTAVISHGVLMVSDFSWLMSTRRAIRCSHPSSRSQVEIDLSSSAAPILSKLQPHFIKMAAEVARELGDDPEPGAREKIIGRVGWVLRLLVNRPNWIWTACTTSVWPR